jgi:hypothetical protein
LSVARIGYSGGFCSSGSPLREARATARLALTDKPRVESPDDPSFVAKDQWI